MKYETKEKSGSNEIHAFHVIASRNSINIEETLWNWRKKDWRILK